MKGGAEVIITGKGSPPKAHSNSSSTGPYSKPPWHDTERYHHEYRKSPSIFVPETRALAAPASSVVSNMSARASSPSHVLYTGQVSRVQPLPKASKPVIRAPPPPLAVSADSRMVAGVPAVLGASRLPPKADKIPITHHGSITHGTPVNQPALVTLTPHNPPSRYEMLTKPVLPREGGSITQGTPVHHEPKRSSGVLPPGIPVKETIIYEPRNNSGVDIIPRPTQVSSYERENVYRGPRPTLASSVAAPSYPFTTYAYASPRPTFSDSQISSRQIIATDYLTSQQMPSRRSGSEKEIRVSPRARDPSPHGDPRDLRNIHIQPAVMDRRSVESHPRTLDLRSERVSDHRAVEFRPVEVVRQLEPRSSVDLRVGPPDTRGIYYTTHNSSYVPHGQPAPPAHYPGPEVRVSRPSASPASIRDATPTPPTSDPSMSPHDFRSPGPAGVTPPPRMSSVIQRRQPLTKPPTTHISSLGKSISPRSDSGRYSPRLGPMPPTPSSDNLHTLADIVVQRANYPLDVRNRDTRAPQIPQLHSSSTLHDPNRLEGFGKQIADSLRSSRGIHDGRPAEKDFRHTGPPDDRRFYGQQHAHSRLEFNRPIRLAETAELHILPVTKEDNELVALDQRKQSPIMKGRINDTVTAGNLIESIICNQLKPHGNEHDPRSAFHRENDGHRLPVCISNKRPRSPLGHHLKEKEIVTVEDSPSPDMRLHPLQNHPSKDSHSHSGMHHHTYPGAETMAAHFDSIISREFTSGDHKKVGGIVSASQSFSCQPQREIPRTVDGRLVSHPSHSPHSAHYDPSKLRNSSQPAQLLPMEKEKERFEAPSHRLLPPSSNNNLSQPPQNLASDERRIIRIAQSQSHPTTQRSDVNSNPCAFDYIKNKLEHILREDDTPDKQSQESPGPRHSHNVPAHLQPSRTIMHTHPPQGQLTSQPLHQSTHFDMDDSVKIKRARLEGPEGSRPPSRPRSAGETKESAPSKEEVVDSPQSGEMIIDESPQSLKVGGDSEGGDRSTHVSSGQQYLHAYGGYRPHISSTNSIPQKSGGWNVTSSGNPPPPTTSSGGKPQGYEPNVEPVSDDD